MDDDVLDMGKKIHDDNLACATGLIMFLSINGLSNRGLCENLSKTLSFQ